MIFVSAWVTSVWNANGLRSQLWYPTVTPGFHGTWEPERPGRAPVRPSQGVVRCEGDLDDRKFASLRAQDSQTNSLIALVGEESHRASRATEWFRSADAGPVAP